MEEIYKFLEKEQDDNLFDREVIGIRYWEYIRPIVSHSVISVVSKTSEMFSKNESSIKKYIPNFKIMKDYFLRKRTCDILIVSQPRRIKTKNGLYRNNYTDYYEDYLKKYYKILTIEEPSYSSFGVSSVAHNFPLYTNNVYFTDFHEIFFLIKKKFYRIFNFKKYSMITKEYEDIRKIVNGWYDTDEIEFKEYYLNSIIRIDLDRKYVKKLIKKINPKIVMLHFMPSVFKLMLVEECNKKGIPTIEIQHGTITKVDPLVNKTYNVNKLKADNKYIFSFGKNQVIDYALSIKNKSNIKTVGFPFFEETLKHYKQKSKKYILVISQSTIGDYMASFTSKLADILKNYSIVFKYHPNELTKNYECLNKSNIIQVKTEKSIYDIQSESFLQIGSYSTSLYEGFALKIPTLILKNAFGSIETIDIFKGIKKGIYYIDKPEDVLTYINRDDILPNSRDIVKLWENNSKIKIIKSVKEIMKEV